METDRGTAAIILDDPLQRALSMLSTFFIRMLLVIIFLDWRQELLCEIALEGRT